MDHHGVLTLTRQLNTVLTGVQYARNTTTPEWKWKGTPVIFPESRCPFCNRVIRSNGIWFLNGDNLYHLAGAIFPVMGQKINMIQPSHPHDTGGGALCLGRNRSGIELLASTPNLRDAPMGNINIPRWQKRYWNRHDCANGREYIRDYSCQPIIRLRELDAI